jgi:hypothetical protein
MTLHSASNSSAHHPEAITFENILMLKNGRDEYYIKNSTSLSIQSPLCWF